MPKGFSEREREIIRQRLLEKGREYLTQYGIRRTNVEDLTRAVGISKGAFYQFYPSKEELFFEVLEQYEARMREELLNCALEAGRSGREGFKQLLRSAFAFWEGNAFLRNFASEDLELLVRKLPEEKVRGHLQRDDAFVKQVVTQWAERGIRFRRPPQEISGLMKALFFVSLHKDDFGADSYPETMDRLIEIIADAVVQEEMS